MKKIFAILLCAVMCLCAACGASNDGDVAGAIIDGIMGGAGQTGAPSTAQPSHTAVPSWVQPGGASQETGNEALWTVFDDAQLDGLWRYDEMCETYADGEQSEVYSYNGEVLFAFYRLLPASDYDTIIDDVLSLGAGSEAMGLVVLPLTATVSGLPVFTFDYNCLSEGIAMSVRDVAVKGEKWLYVLHTAVYTDRAADYADAIDGWINSVYLLDAAEARQLNREKLILRVRGFDAAPCDSGTEWNGDGTFTDAYMYDGTVYVQFGRFGAAADQNAAIAYVAENTGVSVSDIYPTGYLPVSGETTLLLNYTSGGNEDTAYCTDVLVMAPDATHWFHTFVYADWYDDYSPTIETWLSKLYLQTWDGHEIWGYQLSVPDDNA